MHTMNSEDQWDDEIRALVAEELSKVPRDAVVSTVPISAVTGLRIPSAR